MSRLMNGFCIFIILNFYFVLSVRLCRHFTSIPIGRYLDVFHSTLCTPRIGE